VWAINPPPTTVPKDGIMSKQFWAITIVATLAMSSLATIPPLRGQEPGGLPPATEPSEIDNFDLGFDRFVNLNMIDQAMRSSDAALAADVALSLLEGERILERSHKAMTADQAFKLALTIAMMNQDTKTISRLAKFSEKNGKKEWSERLTVAKTLAAGKRAVEPVLNVENMNSDALEVAEIVLSSVNSAKISGDRTTLEDLKRILPGNKVTTTEQRSQMLKLIESTLAALPKEPDADSIFAQLAAPARGPAGTLDISIDGGTVVPVATAKKGQCDIVAINSLGATAQFGTLAIQNGEPMGINTSKNTVTVKVSHVVREKYWDKVKFVHKWRNVTVVDRTFTMKKSVGLTLTGGPSKYTMK